MVFRVSVPALILALMLLGFSGCGRADVKKKSACDGLLFTEEGLTREAYLPCAGEILDAMDALRPEVEAAVEGDKEAKKRARRAYRALRKLVKKAGGRNLLEEWRDRRLTDLNIFIHNAYTSYWAATLAPNRTDLQSATQNHEDARRLYEVL